MDDNLGLEKELDNVENVEPNNIQDVEIQNDIKDINSKVDELNVLINQKNSKKENLEVELKKENNLIQINNQVFGNKEKTIVDLKKEIFNHRKLIRWTSFCSIFVVLLILLSFFVYWLSYYLEYVWKVNWIINHEIYFNSQNCNRAMEINGVIYNVPNFIDKSYIYSCGWLIFFPMSIFLWSVSGIFLLISWILNINLLVKIKNLRKLYLPFFIFSFVIPFLTWLYCIGLIAFMKYKNKINYYKWMKEIKITKIQNKYNNKTI